MSSFKESTEKIIYQKGDDEIADISNELDFSQAFKNRKIAEALCHENPQEERILKRKVNFIETQKRRRKNDHRIKQREFFITQLFEKGLNPYLGNTAELKVYTEEKGEENRSIPKKINNGRMPERDLSNKAEYSVGVSFGIVRSQTIGDLNLSTTSNRQSTWKLIQNPNPGTMSQSVSNMSTDKRSLCIIKENTFMASNMRSVRPGKEVDSYPKSVPSSPTKEELDKIKIPAVSDKPDLKTLRRNPNLLFPKLRGLLGENTLGSIRSRNNTPNTNVPVHFQRLPIVRIQSGEPEKIDSKHMRKTITKLSTDLPEHLKETAKYQIRKMTNSDQIYERKEQLKAENIPKLEREHSFGDRRWYKLEKALSPTVGVGTRWRQLYKTGPWVLENKYKFC